MAEWRDMELTSSCQYIYTWNNFFRIPIESFQKISYNQSCKKDPHITG